MAEQRAIDIDRALLALAQETLGDNIPLAIVAVGGYGRGELSRHSDIDLLFLAGSTRSEDVTKGTLRGLLYPLWDAGFQVGHAVATPKSAIERTKDDLHAATAVLSARLVAGSPELFEELLDRRRRWIEKDRKNLIRGVVASTEERHRTSAPAGWSLAPDLKNGIGGARDLHTIQWFADLTGSEVRQDLGAPYGVLMAVREALHSEVARKLDRVPIDLQAAVARRMGLKHPEGRDELMSAVHSAARRIEFACARELQIVGEEARRGPRRSGSATTLSANVTLEDGTLHLRSSERSPAIALELLAARSRTGRPLAPRAIDALTESFSGAHAAEAEPWTTDVRGAFLALLGGEHCESALRLLDHAGGWDALIPEWRQIRARAQHDPYHHYTVDGHSFLAVRMIHQVITENTEAKLAADETGDLRTLLIATLLHDVGKGSGEDHSIAGERIAQAVCRRMGLDDRDTDEVAALVRHHLLLPDTATRRDIEDGSVVRFVADIVGTARRARLLFLLAAADGMATGPDAWTSWKRSLVGSLFRQVVHALETGDLPERADVAVRQRELSAYEPLLASAGEKLLPTMPPSYLDSTQVEVLADEVRLLMDPPGPGEIRSLIDHLVEGHTSVTVVLRDRPGSLARSAGVLALHRASVLSAQAFTTTDGMALERFVVKGPPETDWGRFEKDLSAAYGGRLALDARLEQKALDYKPHGSLGAEVTALQDESEHSTIIEVRSRDAVGLLYTITRAIGDLDANIHVAKIDTLAERVVDVFYVRSLSGAKLDDVQVAELRREITHRINRFFG